MAKKLWLNIELVPKGAWGQSISKLARKKKGGEKLWRELKENLIKNEGEKCFICQKKGVTLEAHERWLYDEIKGIQYLRAIHHLCPMCHRIKHFGHSVNILKMPESELIKYFCLINKCTKEEFYEHQKNVFSVWKRRNLINWKTDFGEYNYFYELEDINNPSLKK